jgi:exodeoxyribonuclease V beta subunit
VKVVTVHKSKGLEYPLVFLPFATEHRQEKAGQNYLAFHDDSGQLQISLAPDERSLKMADRERLGEDIRKLYVALTRARHATWVGAAGIKNWHQSGLGHLLSDSGEPSDADLTPLLQAMANHEPGIRILPAPEPDDIAYAGEPEPPLGPALEPKREARENWWIASYSAITYGALSGFSGDFQPASEDAEQENLLEEDEQSNAADASSSAIQPQGKHAFPKGSGPGTFLHDILEWCATRGFDRVVAQPDELHTLLTRRCQLRHWDDWVDVLHDWILKLLIVDIPLPLPEPESKRDQTCTLATLTNPRPELEFWFESRQVNTVKLDRLVQQGTLTGDPRPRAHDTTFNGMLKGFIDLVFEHQGRYYVLDYKSNTLGDDDSAYVPDAMRAKILESRYDLQYVIYLLALHRLLKARLPDYDYDTHIGGAVYLFLRGCDAPGAGAFTERPDKSLIESLDRLFCGQPEVAV